MKKEKAFKVTINDTDFNLTRENTDIYIHRPSEFHDLDYLRIFDFDTEAVTNIFRLQEMCRMMAGIAFNENGFPLVPAFKNGETFKDRFGWFSDSYLRDKPSEENIAGFAMVEVSYDIDEQGKWDLDGAA